MLAPALLRSVEDMSTQSIPRTDIRVMQAAEVALSVAVAVAFGVSATGLFPDDPTAAVFAIPVGIGAGFLSHWAIAFARRRYLRTRG